MAAAEDAPEMSKPQTAALQSDIAAILLPGESVTRALQRLGNQDKRPAGATCSASCIQHLPCAIALCQTPVAVVKSVHGLVTSVCKFALMWLTVANQHSTNSLKEPQQPHYTIVYMLT